MGNSPSQPPRKPQKFHLTPPRIFLVHQPYITSGKINVGQLAQSVTKDFICPNGYSFGGTLQLSERVSDTVLAQCDADIAVGPKGATAKGGIRVSTANAICAAELSELTEEEAASIFAQLQLFPGQAPEVGAGLIWRPSITFGGKKKEKEISIEEEWRNAPKMKKSEIPKSRNSAIGVAPTWNQNEYVVPPITLSSSLSAYAKKQGKQKKVGTQISLRSSSFFTELVAEIDAESGEVVTSDLGCSWLLDQTHTPNAQTGNLEVSLVLRNAISIVDNAPKTAASSEKEPKVVLSFYKHMVIPRKIFAAVDSRFKLISNYIDFGFELGLNPKDFLESAPDTTKSHIPLDVKLAASWQLNKNNLLKFKIDPEAVAASYTIKSWWQPRCSLSFTGSFNIQQRISSLGLWIVLDTGDKMEHQTATKKYSESVGYTITNHVSDADTEFV